MIRWQFSFQFRGTIIVSSGANTSLGTKTLKLAELIAAKIEKALASRSLGVIATDLQYNPSDSHFAP